MRWPASWAASSVCRTPSWRTSRAGVRRWRRPRATRKNLRPRTRAPAMRIRSPAALIRESLIASFRPSPARGAAIGPGIGRSGATRWIRPWRRHEGCAVSRQAWLKYRDIDYKIRVYHVAPREAPMRLPLAIGAPLVLVYPAFAQTGASSAADAPVAFAPVTTIPVPLQSTSGRFSSLNPSNQLNCGYSGRMIGRVVSARLLMVDVTGGFCHVAEVANALVNVELTNPADSVQMVPGRRVVITATFRRAQEARTSRFYAEYLIAQKAELVAGDPRGAPAPAFMSYMICQ